MRARLWFALHVLAALLAAGAAVAEPIGSHFQLTPFGGFTMFDPKLRYPGSNAPLTDDLYVGGRLSWESKSWIGIEAAAGMTPTVEDLVVGGNDYDWTHASGNLVLSPARGRWGNPYVFVGAGYTQLKPATGEKRSTNTFEFGGGVKLWMTDAVGLRFEARDVSFKPLENLSGQNHFHNMVLGAGLTFALGATPRDTDGDGVPDRKDKCPGTPMGATVDSKGCPSDAVGDGVFDGIDTCADTPKGATVDAKGCPSDSDNDGVLDGLDACPNTPAGAKVDAKGCPTDADADGVFDGLDECAETPAGLKVDAKGCPIEVMERETELLDTGLIRLNDVNFETGKAEIMPESYATLDAAGAVMLKWPQLRIEIGGHTDSRGGVARNKALSEARADSVRAYILRKFPALSPTQFSTKGYGPTRPVAPNTNPLNMAKNRRVEFVVLNKEVLKKEVERRRLLRQSESTPADSSATPK